MRALSIILGLVLLAAAGVAAVGWSRALVLQQELRDRREEVRHLAKSLQQAEQRLDRVLARAAKGLDGKSSGLPAPGPAAGVEGAEAGPDADISPDRSPEELYALARRAAEAGDEPTARAHAEALAASLRKNPSKAIDILYELEEETDPRIVKGLHEVLVKSGAWNTPEFRAEVLEWFRRETDPLRRASAMDFLARTLEAQPLFLDEITPADRTLLRDTLSESGDVPGADTAARILSHFPQDPGMLQLFRTTILGDTGTGTPARLAAMEALRRYPAREVAEDLLAVIREDPEASLRRKAAETLAWVRPTELEDRVFLALEDNLPREEDAEVRKAGLLAMIRLSPVRTLTFLDRWVPTEPDPGQRRRLEAVAQVLRGGDEDWWKILMEAGEKIRRIEAEERR